ncbi:MAG TPA: branched-chain amino acid ABC transporter permease [Acidimicrobiales bacterium]|nr:branched-chain amino acid ABC transporter permease [Acidimicrobiales bacterium]
MRRALLAIVCTVAVLTAAPARAEEVRHGYQHTTGVPTFVGQADRAYVAGAVGVETARAFVAAPAAFTIVAASMTGEPVLGACPLTSPLVGDGERSSDTAPAADCSSVTPVDRTDAGWLVSLTPWPRHGVALVPLLEPTTSFELAIDTTRTSLVAAPAVVDTPTTTTTVVPMTAPAFEAPPVPDVAAPPAVEPPGSPEPAIVERVAAQLPHVLSATSPPAVVVLPLVGFVTAGLLLLRRRGVRAPIPTGAHPPLVGATALVAVPLLVLSEANVYKLGLVLIVMVAAIGLHVLVTWAGELSLAQAPIVGLPAFAVAKLSADHGLSPVYLLPLAIVVGVVTGALVGLPALRARGLQVALVTLAAGVAIDRFFFTREWVVGPPGGAAVATPTIGPLELTTARSLWPVLAVVVLGAVTAAWVIDHSKIGRGLRWVKAHPDGAAAFGIPVSRYRALAYGIAGAFAGLAGGLTAMWVQRMTPQAFPLGLSFTYLIIVALAGRGFVGGVAAAAVAVEGGRLFLAGGGALIAYAAPLGLILTLTRHQSGLNGFGRRAAELIKERTMQHRIRIPSVIGGALVAVGFAAIALAWYHAGNTDQVWVQNQELISGGIGGLALVVLGSALLVVDWLASVLATRAEP